MVYRRKPAKKQDVGSALKDVFGTLDYDDGDSGDEDAGLKEIAAADGKSSKKKETPIVYNSPREAILKRPDVKVASQGQRMKCPWGKSSSLWPANIENLNYNTKGTSSKSVKKLLDFLESNDIVAAAAGGTAASSSSPPGKTDAAASSSPTSWPKRSISGQHKSKAVAPGSPSNNNSSSSPQQQQQQQRSNDAGFPANVILHQMPLSELATVLCLGDAEVTVKYNSDESIGKGIGLQSLELPDPYRPKGTPIPEKYLNIFLPTEQLLDDLKVAESRGGSGASPQKVVAKPVEEEASSPASKKLEEDVVTDEMKEKRRRKAERLKRESSGASAQQQSENQALKRLMSTQVESDEDDDGPSRVSVGRRRSDALKSKSQEPEPVAAEVASESSIQMPSPAKSETTDAATTAVVKPATTMEEPRGGMYGVGTHPNWHMGHPENLSEVPSTGIDRINVPRLQGHKEIPFSAPGSSPGSRSNSPARRGGGLVDHNFASASRYGAGGIAYATRGVDHSFDEDDGETIEERELRERIIRELGGVPLDSQGQPTSSSSRDVSYAEIHSAATSQRPGSLFRVEPPIRLAGGGGASSSGRAGGTTSRSRSATSLGGGVQNRPVFRPTASPSPGWRNANTMSTPAGSSRRTASPSVASRQGYSRSASARSASTQPRGGGVNNQQQVAVITLSQASGGGTISVRSSSTPHQHADHGRATLTMSRPTSPSPAGGGAGVNRMSGMLKGSPIYMQQRYEAIRQDHASRGTRPAPAVSARLYQPPPSSSNTPRSTTTTLSGRGGVVSAGRPQIGAYQYTRY